MPILFAAIIWATLSQQAAHASFDGYWVQARENKPGPAPVCDAACTIEQAPDAITVDIGMMHGIRYKLDGAQVMLTGSAPGPITFTLKRTAAWDGDSIQISETYQGASLNGGKPFTTTAHLSVSGGRLTIQGVNTDKNGLETKYSVVYEKKQP